MNPLDQDTSAASQERYFELLGRLSPLQRLRIVNAITYRTRKMTEAGIRLRNPSLTEEEFRAEFRRIRYGDPADRTEQ